MNSSIYFGNIRHRRFSPKSHDFNYEIALFYFDLSEIGRIFNIPLLFSEKGPALLAFRRKNYLGNPEISLDAAVRGLILERTAKSHDGPIRILTQISYFGFCFNPVSFYYCFNPAGTELNFIIAEITNTPWGERHAYVLECDRDDGIKKNTEVFRFLKNFHVSPFMPMNMSYLWRFSQPEKLLNIHMENFSQANSEKVFDSTLVLRRTPFSRARLASILILFPLLTLKAFIAIYFQALRLWLKKVPFFPHPTQAPSIQRVRGDRI